MLGTPNNTSNSDCFYEQPECSFINLENTENVKSITSQSLGTYFPKNGKVIAHLNIQSLLPKIEELRLHVAHSGIKILSINETFLDDTVDDDEIEIPGFLLFRNDLSRSGGGSSIYVCESLSPCLIKQIPCTNHVEALTVKVIFGNTPFLITCCYRQPSHDLTSYTKLENIMEDILNLNCNSVFLGHFNIDYKA